jgi:hypothetical protein
MDGDLGVAMLKSVRVAMAIAVTSIAVSARAQTETKPDPVRLALAHEVLEAQGVSRQYDARIKSALSVQTQIMKQIVAGEEASPVAEMFNYMAEEELKAVPRMLEDAATVYADNLSATELRDMLKWTKSPSGSAFYAKVPAIDHELLLRQVPILTTILGGAVSKAVERTCAEKPCSPEQRQTLTEMGHKLLNGVS